MAYKNKEIKKGIKIHYITTKKFKTNIVSVFLTTPLDRKTVTCNALIPAVLRRGTMNLKSQEEISKKLEEMYGASFDCGIEKTGDYQILKFYLEAVNDNYLTTKESNLEAVIDMLLEIVFNPLIENNCFRKEYVETEKINLEKIIKSKIDNKDRYAYERCIEKMYDGKTYGLYKYGYVEDLEDINESNLYENYLNLINNSKIDIFISGDINEERLLENIKQSIIINRLQERKELDVTQAKVDSEKNKNPNVVEEKLDVTQGKLVIGTDVDFNKKDAKYKISLFNVILGEGATSKLFQNVREKEGLAYTARSNYVRQKQNIFIRCGIEIKNHEKAVAVIKEQLEDLKNGDFTSEDLEDAKKYVLASLRSVEEEQDAEISYYFGQELSEEFATLKQYEDKINRVTIEDIKEVANGISINTIYFLRN